MIAEPANGHGAEQGRAQPKNILIDIELGVMMGVGLALFGIAPGEEEEGSRHSLQKIGHVLPTHGGL